MHYMHGLGIVSQYTENVTMDRVRCAPRPGSGRLLAASADMMHFSGCKGKILIDSCYCAGAQDDPVNVHGNNTYYKTGMSAILIEADAEGWYESGPVKDVWIKGNTFIDCAYNGGPGHAVIAIHPSNKIVDASHPVHQNIRIENNTFKTFDCPVLYAKSTAGLLFRNNTITRTRTFPATAGNP